MADGSVSGFTGDGGSLIIVDMDARAGMVMAMAMWETVSGG